jgi:hypothetical protein
MTKFLPAGDFAAGIFAVFADVFFDIEENEFNAISTTSSATI